MPLSLVAAHNVGAGDETVYLARHERKLRHSTIRSGFIARGR